MMPKRKQIDSRDGGWIDVYAPKTLSTDFAARRNVKQLPDMDFIVRLAFRECSKRDEDMDFAEREGYVLSLKVSTIRRPNIRTGMCVVANGVLYDISSIDHDGRNRMFMYLTEVRSL